MGILSDSATYELIDATRLLPRSTAVTRRSPPTKGAPDCLGPSPPPRRLLRVPVARGGGGFAGATTWLLGQLDRDPEGRGSDIR